MVYIPCVAVSVSLLSFVEIYFAQTAPKVSVIVSLKAQHHHRFIKSFLTCTGAAPVYEGNDTLKHGRRS